MERLWRWFSATLVNAHGSDAVVVCLGSEWEPKASIVFVGDEGFIAYEYNNSEPQALNLTNSERNKPGPGNITAREQLHRTLHSRSLHSRQRDLFLPQISKYNNKCSLSMNANIFRHPARNVNNIRTNATLPPVWQYLYVLFGKWQRSAKLSHNI